MQVAMCTKTIIKEKISHLNQTKFSESIKRQFISDNDGIYPIYISNTIADYLSKNNATITITNRKNNTEISITSEDDYILWAHKTSSMGIWDYTISCVYDTIDSTGAVSNTLIELTWEDFWEYCEFNDTPLLILQIYDNDTGKLLDERKYQTDARMFNYLKKHIVKSETNNTAPIYKNKECRIVVNDIDVSEHYSPAETHFLASASYDTSIVIFDVMINGLY